MNNHKSEMIKRFCNKVDALLLASGNKATVIGGYVQGSGALVTIQPPLFIDEQTRAIISDFFDCECIAVQGAILMNGVSDFPNEPLNIINDLKEAGIMQLINDFQAGIDQGVLRSRR